MAAFTGGEENRVQVPRIQTLGERRNSDAQGPVRKFSSPVELDSGYGALKSSFLTSSLGNSDKLKHCSLWGTERAEGWRKGNKKVKT